MKTVRIKDIAKRAQVSTGTVDRVLHNRGKVSEEKKQRVEAAIKELGYQKNIIASALAYNKVFKIGILIPEPNKDLYWMQINEGIEEAFKTSKHYGVSRVDFLFDLSDPDNFEKEISKAQCTDLDAILLAPIFFESSQMCLAHFEEENIPVATLNTHIENESLLSYIGQDSYQCGVLGARLLDFGLKPNQTVVILNLAKGTVDGKHYVDKTNGFFDYFAQQASKEVQVVQEAFEEFENPAELNAYLQSLIRAYPDIGGLFITNSRAHLVVKQLSALHCEHIKIVGFDLIQPNIKYLYEDKISFLINQNPKQQGYLGIMNIVNHLILKNKIPAVQYLPLDTVVKENAKYYLNKNDHLQFFI